MNVDELQSVQSRERQTDQLQQLRPTFYEEAGQFVAQLREERERAAERADDPFDSPEVNRLSDDIKTAEQTVEAIYERRIGKIVKMASLAAADMPTEDGGLTQEERSLFETMVTAIEDNRQHVLDVVGGDVPTGGERAEEPEPSQTTQQNEDVPDPSPDKEIDPEIPPDEMPDAVSNATDTTTVDASDLMGGSETQQEPPADDADSAIGDGGTAHAERSDTTTAIQRTTVRITDDVGEIFGVDQREYDLSANDIVTLPTDNADPLIERDAAEPLD
jgi:DNA replication factor GINS